MSKLVVIGAGMATSRLLKELAALHHDFDIEVIGEEPYPCYNRILLSSLLAETTGEEDISLLEDQWYTDHGIQLSLGETATALDIQNRHISTDKGRQVTYDVLIIATGSAPFYPDIAGIDEGHVFSFRNKQDLEAIREGTTNVEQGVVIGGGLLGLEAAHGLNKLGVSVTVVNLEPWLMPRQLDSEAGALLQQTLEQQGMAFRLGVTPQHISPLSPEPGSRIGEVKLSSGESLPAGIVLVTAGIVPNIELAKMAGIACNRGILVNHSLKTDINNVYALGECCETAGHLFGLVDPVYQQAIVLAQTLTQGMTEGFTPTTTATQLKVAGVSVASSGHLPFADNTESQVILDQHQGIYRRLVFDGDKLVGFVLIGDKAHHGWYQQLIDEQTNVDSLRPQMMFGMQPAIATIFPASN